MGNSHMGSGRAYRSRRILAGSAAVLALGTGLIAGCSTKNADVSCSGDTCTATFNRNADSQVSVLGVDIKLADVQGDKAVIDVDGRSVTVPVGQKADVLNGQFTVEVKQVSQDDVVVQVSRNSG